MLLHEASQEKPTYKIEPVFCLHSSSFSEQRTCLRKINKIGDIFAANVFRERKKKGRGNGRREKKTWGKQFRMLSFRFFTCHFLGGRKKTPSFEHLISTR